ncbi:MAG: threonine/serine dehydratase [Gemmatimonadaceae bacterium]
MTLFSQVQAADVRLRGHIEETPFVTCRSLSDAMGTEVVVKAEHRQHTGSFKLRGAFNRLLTLGREERARGVVAASSGNHGAAVAYACAVLGISAKVLVPETASSAKLMKIREQGAEVVLFGTDGLDTELEARRLSHETGAPYVSPYNDETVMAGQGTLAVELVRQGAPLDRVYVAVGGGGLIGGMAAYLTEAAPNVRIVGALPVNSPVMAESVRAGRVVEMESLPTLSDGTAGGIEEGSITFGICRALVHEWVTVSEDEIARAMRLWAASHESAIEGAAGVAIAAMLREAAHLGGQRVGVVICGGNIAMDRWREVVGHSGRRAK